MTTRTVGVRFRERTKGILACGPDDRPLTRFNGLNGLRWQPLAIDLVARVEDIGAFVTSPKHRVGFERGTVESGHFGRCTVSDAEIELLVRGRELDDRELRYRVCFTTATDDEFTLIGYKDIKGGRFRFWYDTTRIFVEVYHGSVRSREQRTTAKLAGVGVLEIPVLTFLLQLTTIRAVGRGWRPWLTGYVRFMWWFSQNLAVPYWIGLRRRLQRRAVPTVSAPSSNGDVHQAQVPLLDESVRR